MINKSSSPASVAEQYIIESIWNNHFAPGSILPAERELSELIGVTRTTLREVLQRLARDGWLTIQHGKPTQVNDFWQTSSLGILETLAHLDTEKLPELIEHLLSARTQISSVFIGDAIAKAPQQVMTLIEHSESLADEPQAFADFDYTLYQQLAFASGNPIYALIFNGFKGLYYKVACYYFTQPQARALALDYYRELAMLAHTQQPKKVAKRVRRYGKATDEIWRTMPAPLPPRLLE